MNFKGDKMGECSDKAKTCLRAFGSFPSDTPLSVKLFLTFHAKQLSHPVSCLIQFVFFGFTHIRIVSAISILSSHKSKGPTGR
jgi:hypothetical protein